MIFAVGRRLAEASSEHLGLVVAVMAIVVLVALWPRIARRIEDWSQHGAEVLIKSAGVAVNEPHCLLLNLHTA
jgi:hypothetical protein